MVKLVPSERIPGARGSRWRTLVLLAVGFLIASLLVIFAGAWYYSGQLNDAGFAVKDEPHELDLQVVALEGARITLRATPEADDDGDWVRAGLFGLEWNGGYGQVGEVLQRDGSQVVRTDRAVDGVPQSGERVRLDSFAFPGDPFEAHGIGFEDVVYESPLGEFPAWFVAGSRGTWAIFVDGKGAERREALRMLPATVEAAMPSLLITYRNDEGAPQSADDMYRYGQTEWEDLEGAVRYALDHGAHNVVLIGYSMGGAIVMHYLHESPLAGRVSAVILDSPVLDFAETVEWAARDHFVPWPLMPLGKQLTAWRFDIDWAELDSLRYSGELSVPILVFHGDDDRKVPVSTSDKLARLAPRLVTYVRMRGAGHVRSWNLDPAAYEAAVAAFLERVVGQ